MSSIMHPLSERGSPRLGVAFINLGSLLAQIVQVAGYPTLLALALARIDYPTWVIGTVLALQWAIVLCLAPLIPKLMGRKGVRRASQTGAIVSLLGLMTLLISGSLGAISASAVLMGAGLTIRWVACDTWIVHTVEPGARGRAIGIHETLMGLGIAVGPLLTLLADGNETVALVTFGGLLVLSTLSFSLGTHTMLEADHTARSRVGLLRLVTRILVLALIAALASGYVETAMVALLPLYLISFDYPAAQALMLLSVFGLGGTVLQLPLGWVADRWGFRRGQYLCLTLIVAGGITLISAISMPWVIAIVLFAWGGCVGGLNTLAVIEAGSTLRGNESGTGMALIAAAYTLGGVIGPIASGAALTTFGGHGAIAIIVLLVTIYGTALTASGFRRAHRR